jgi:cytidine deaminase
MSEQEALILAARKAREHAHAPYSNFRVGAAVRAKSGRIFTGCNVENATYGLTLSASQFSRPFPKASADSMRSLS